MFAGAWLVTRFTRRAERGPVLARHRRRVGARRHRLHRLAARVRPGLHRRASGRRQGFGVLAGSLLAAVAGAVLLGHRDRFHATP
ncbi:MAG: hypothetical protein R2734_04360 [Nocardioides sp.]